MTSSNHLISKLKSVSSSFYWYKNCKNRARNNRVIIENKVARFYVSRCMSACMCLCICACMYVCVSVSTLRDSDDKRHCYVTVTALPPTGHCHNCSQLAANVSGLCILLFNTLFYKHSFIHYSLIK